MYLVNNKALFLVSMLTLTCGQTLAQVGIAFGSGQGIHNIVPYRLAVSWDFGPIWHEEKTWGLNAVWESSFAIWDGPQRPDLAPDRVTDLHATTTGPMLRWQRQSPLFNRFIPYSELGVGLSWLSETEIEGRILSLHFQFEDKIGIGTRFGKNQQYDIALRAYHYSNASIKRPNSGVNLAMVNFGVWLSQ